MEGRVAVLASGSGTNLQALLDHPSVGPRIALVVSDRPRAGALERARERAVETLVLDPPSFPTREAHDEALLATLSDGAIDVVVLAGYMRILGPDIVAAFRGRIVNVHPSLLPAFPGARPVADALAHGVRVTGVTVHLVDEEVDHGLILRQEAVAILDGDDLGSLTDRLHAVEHRLLPEVTAALLEDHLQGEGRRASLGDRA